MKDGFGTSKVKHDEPAAAGQGLTLAPRTTSTVFMTEDTDPAPEPKASPPRASSPKPDLPAGPPSWGGLFLYLAKRPLLLAGGALVCGLVLTIGSAIRPSIGEDLFNLASYIPVLGGAWAVWAGAMATRAAPQPQWPDTSRILRFASTAFVVLVVAKLVGLVVPIVGTPLAECALALSPVIALADLRWPPSALWRCVLVVEQNPKAYGVFALTSIGILVMTMWLVPTLLGVSYGAFGGGRGFVAGLARGLGWGIIAGLCMRYYLNFEQAHEDG